MKTFPFYFSGLERIAEELMGRTKWREYQETVLSTCRTDESIPMESKDWEPSDKCNLCQENKTACSDAATLPVSILKCFH